MQALGLGSGPGGILKVISLWKQLNGSTRQPPSSLRASCPLVPTSGDTEAETQPWPPAPSSCIPFWVLHLPGQGQVS